MIPNLDLIFLFEFEKKLVNISFNLKKFVFLYKLKIEIINASKNTGISSS